MYRIGSLTYTTTKGLSAALDGHISQDKVTRFLLKKLLISSLLQQDPFH
jgi:hypothetical protein